MEREHACFFCGAKFKSGSMSMWILYEEGGPPCGKALWPCVNCAFFYDLMERLEW